MKKVLFILLLLVSVTGGIIPSQAQRAKPKVEYVLICNSSSAYAYHSYECRGLSRCTHEISKVTKKQAIKLGYRACRICY
ncbi:hypothetical protein FFF34_002825 [Inquilinus sp. KBS0705]|nr:hypothetical protein FFF34_002825 [Inquilinus sp. KBS0705]